MDDWTPISGFPKYSVNSLGQVRHDRTGHLLHPQTNQRGMPYMVLMRESRHASRSLALLVARAFLPPLSEAFDTPINLDGDRFNCAVSNLAWRPRWFALQYHRQFKERYFNPILVPIKNLDTGEEFPDGLEACIRYGLLERDLFLSIANQTVPWPLMNRFDVVD